MEKSPLADENESILEDADGAESLNNVLMIEEDSSSKTDDEPKERLDIFTAENFTTNSLFSMNSFDQTLEMRKIVREIFNNVKIEVC